MRSRSGSCVKYDSEAIAHRTTCVIFQWCHAASGSLRSLRLARRASAMEPFLGASRTKMTFSWLTGRAWSSAPLEWVYLEKAWEETRLSQNVHCSWGWFAECRRRKVLLSKVRIGLLAHLPPILMPRGTNTRIGLTAALKSFTGLICHKPLSWVSAIYSCYPTTSTNL